MSEERRILQIPKSQRVIYPRNLIETAVCELRFPTLPELDVRPPQKLQNTLRKEYPIFEVQQRAQFGGVENTPGSFRYLFHERKRRWTVCVHSTAISLETKRYSNFEDFSGRLDSLLKRSEDLIDSDFFTRVGLRYINFLPIGDGSVHDWLNPKVASGYLIAEFGQLSKFTCEMTGACENGKYNFRHGVAEAKDQGSLKYMLDFDYYEEDVESGDVRSLIDQFHKTNFDFFMWCLGPKSLEYMNQKG